MFETIGNLFTICFWAVTLFLFLGGIITCIANFLSGDGGKIFWAVVAIILAIFVFFLVYDWLDSIAWCLLVTGMVLVFVANIGSDETESTPTRKQEYGLSDAILDTYCEYELTKAAVKDAIKESKK